MTLKVLIALAISVMSGAALAQAPKISIGVVSSTQSVATLIAQQRGYFKDAGLDVELQEIASTATAMSLVARNQLHIAEGGFAISYFNAVAQGLPVIMAMERGSTPIYHAILLRPALKDTVKSIADLKGRSVALGGPGTILTYELGKILETAGLTLDDVDIKYVPFPSMGAALQNGAVDAALSVPPFASLNLENGIGVMLANPDDLIQPAPYGTNAYFANTDWIKANPEIARKAFVALARGARDYCQAYHGGQIRKEALDLLIEHIGKDADRAILDRVPWQARDPNGKFNATSVLDIQDWFVKHKMLEASLPIEKLISTRFSDAAEKELGPFKVENTASTAKGCR